MNRTHAGMAANTLTLILGVALKRRAEAWVNLPKQTKVLSMQEGGFPIVLPSPTLRMKWRMGMPEPEDRAQSVKPLNTRKKCGPRALSGDKALRMNRQWCLSKWAKF